MTFSGLGDYHGIKSKPPLNIGVEYIMNLEIRKRIRALREQRGLSAATVAKRVGISRPFYTLIEGGKRRLTVELLEKIAGSLRVTVVELYSSNFGSSEQVGLKGFSKPIQHLRPINTPELREKLEPLLGSNTDDFVACYQLWVKAPKDLKRRLQSN